MRCGTPDAYDLPVRTPLFAATALCSASLLAADAPPAFVKSCAPCHGKRGAADTPVAKSLGVKRLDAPDVQKKKDEEILAVIDRGKGKMPSFAGKISEADVKAIVAFIRSLAKK